MVKCRKKFILLQNSNENSPDPVTKICGIVSFDILSISEKKSLYKVTGFLYNSTCGPGL